MPDMPAWARYVLTFVIATLSAAQTMLPLPELAQGIVAVLLVGFAALGIVPPRASRP